MWGDENLFVGFDLTMLGFGGGCLIAYCRHFFESVFLIHGKQIAERFRGKVLRLVRRFLNRAQEHVKESFFESEHVQL